MAIFVPHLQKSFKLVFRDGLPQAPVEQIRGTNWLRCCPLCGSVHQIQTIMEDVPFTPLCQTHADLFKAELVAWHKQYPDVVKFKSLYLVAKAS